MVYTAYICPAFTLSGTPGAGIAGQAYSANLSQSGALGVPNFTITAGALPPGLSLSASGAISGTPLAVGTFNFTVTVADNSGCSGSQTYSISISSASPTLTLALTAGSNPSATGTNATFAATFANNGTLTGSGAVAFCADATTVDAACDGGSTLCTATANTSPVTCTSNALAAGNHAITAFFSGDANNSAAASAALTQGVGSAPAISSANSVIFTYGTASSFTITTTGTPTPALTESGALPAGIIFIDNNNGTAMLAGTPAAGTEGNYPIVIGASNLVGPTSQTFTLTVQPAPTKTTIAPPNAITLGQSVTVAVTVAMQPPGTLTPTGSVTIRDGGVSCTATLNNGSGSCLLTPPAPAGSQTLSATYTNTADFATSTGTAALIVNAATAGAVLTSSVNPSIHGQSVTLTAQVTGQTPAGSVTFADGAVTLCGSVALSGGGDSPTATCTTSALLTGADLITASYTSSDANNTDSSVTLTQTVNKAATALTVTATQASISFGASITVNATLSVTSPGAGAPSGTINVSDGVGDSCSISLPAMSCTLTPANTGNLTLAANYTGDTDFAASSATASVGVNAAPTSLSLTSSPNPSNVGQAVTFTATVSAAAAAGATAAAGTRPTVEATASGSSRRIRAATVTTAVPIGSVSFADNGTMLATVALNASGVAIYSTTSLTAGAHTITATYSGSASNASATITEVQQVIPAKAGATLVAAPALSVRILALLGLVLAGAGLCFGPRSGRK